MPIEIQWNLFVADMLYSGHLPIADTFFRNQLSPTMVKPLYFEPLYSGHLSIADTFSENQWCPLLRGFTVTSKTRTYRGHLCTLSQVRLSIHLKVLRTWMDSLLLVTYKILMA